MALAHEPIQVYLRSDQKVALRELARSRGISMAELMRRGVDLILNEVEPDRDPLWNIVGTVDDDGPTDMALHHDCYLADAGTGAPGS
jgi:hypothetical protein